jgi:hypothetical protein
MFTLIPQPLLPQGEGAYTYLEVPLSWRLTYMYLEVALSWRLTYTYLEVPLSWRLTYMCLEVPLHEGEGFRVRVQSRHS